MTPRKPKQRQQHHHPTPTQRIQASDYESDVQNYNQNHVPPPTRTNTELNLSVLRRHNPAIRTILSIAANAVIYKFIPDSQTWEKSGVEGTLFVCEQDARDDIVEAAYCVVILNRRGLGNLIIDLAQAQHVEFDSETLIIQYEEESGDNNKRVVGIWIHKDKDDTREVNASLIIQCWEKVKQARSDGLGESSGGVDPPADGDATKPEAAGMGRRISLSDLFHQQGSQ